jgi:hypothetical protein
LQHSPPGLLTEFYGLKVLIKNGEKQDMRAYMNISCKLEEASGRISQPLNTLVLTLGAGIAPERVKDLIYVDSSLNGSAAIEDLDLGQIARKKAISKELFLQCRNHPGNRVIVVTVD